MAAVALHIMPRLKNMWYKYLFFCIPAKDIRTKEARKATEEIEGLLDKSDLLNSICQPSGELNLDPALLVTMPLTEEASISTNPLIANFDLNRRGDHIAIVKTVFEVGRAMHLESPDLSVE